MALKMKRTKRMAVVVDPSVCQGCHSCELECAVAHSAAKSVYGAALAGERPGFRIHVESYEGKGVPVNCRHCEVAACMIACPTNAIYRNGPDEPVLIEDRRCIGCLMCVHACPFGVISVRLEHKGVMKCDLCIERLDEGLEPACVVACPTRALAYAEDEESNRSKRQRAAQRLMAARPDDAEGSR